VTQNNTFTTKLSPVPLLDNKNFDQLLAYLIIYDHGITIIIPLCHLHAAAAATACSASV